MLDDAYAYMPEGPVFDPGPAVTEPFSVSDILNSAADVTSWNEVAITSGTDGFAIQDDTYLIDVPGGAAGKDLGPEVMFSPGDDVILPGGVVEGPGPDDDPYDDWWETIYWGGGGGGGGGGDSGGDPITNFLSWLLGDAGNALKSALQGLGDSATDLARRDQASTFDRSQVQPWSHSNGMQGYIGQDGTIWLDQNNNGQPETHLRWIGNELWQDTNFDGTWDRRVR